ncbi:SAV_915 family protein [Salinifilum ghardaiensis]
MRHYGGTATATIRSGRVRRRPGRSGAEYAGAEEGDGDSTAFIATQRVGPQDAEARVELRENESGQWVMLAYSSHERLVTGAGEAQPWIAVPADRVSQVQQDCGAEVVLWDVELPAQMQHTSSEEEGS